VSTPVRLEERDGVLLLWLDRGANALHLAAIVALDTTIGDLSRSTSAPALVLTSSHPSVFCPGLDLKALDGQPRQGIRDVLSAFNAMVRRLATYPGPAVAAVAGHAIAGGCLLALACDRRVMARSGARIGLSEVNLGFPVPAGAVAMLLALYPTRAVEQLVLEGDGFGGERALELGLVERLADTPAVLAEACWQARHLASRPARAYAAARAFLRHRLAATMAQRDEEEMEGFLDLWFDPQTQDRIGALLASMGR
jgi:enoyl-CoA hydratase